LHNVEAGLGSRLAGTSQHVVVCGSINPLAPELIPQCNAACQDIFTGDFKF